MIVRDPPLQTPPTRPPYFRVAAPDGAELVLRRPSLPTVAVMLKSIPEELQLRVAVRLEQIAKGGSLLEVLLMADDVLPLLAALVGMAWADPRLRLQSARGEDIAAYGEAVHEELHEEGWELQHVVLAALAVMDQIQLSAQASAELAPEVARRTAFFRPRRATPSASASPSRSTTSDGGEEPPSTS